ncbi:MAG: hypothetical protein ACPGJV_04960 [Bacteriovoracaceae bacterium]
MFEEKIHGENDISDTPEVKKNFSLAQIEEMNISYGYLYWLKQKSEGKVLLLRPGDIVNHKFFEKFNESHNFYMEWTCSISAVLDFENLLKAFSVSRTEKSRIESMINAVIWTKEQYWETNEEAALLSLCVPAFNVFRFEEFESYKAFYEIHTELFRRALKVAGLSVVSAMTLGYTDFELLREFYNLNFLSVFEIAVKNNKYDLLEKLEQKRVRDTNWGDDASRDVPEYEVIEEFKFLFENESVLDCSKFVLRHLDSHESIYCEDACNDLEALFFYLQSHMDFKEVKFSRFDGNKLLWILFKSQGEGDALYRVKTVVAKKIESIVAIDKSYLEMIA